ncbi:hypothetical protein [Dactylosporangium salmoneum]|uniref:Uncharacterized protein n=1 Tax=Dactylosporangium salmoneum TaxID=53361 RepID=A0ABP5U7J0_9ACTN
MTRVYTEHAVFRITPSGAEIAETFGTPADELRARLALPGR